MDLGNTYKGEEIPCFWGNHGYDKGSKQDAMDSLE